MFLEKRELLLQIPLDQLLGLSIIYMMRISHEIVYLKRA